MAYATYVVAADKGLAQLRRQLLDVLATKAKADGSPIDTTEPLVPVSGVRAIVPSAIVETLVATQPGTPVPQILAGLQANLTEARVIGPDEIADLLATREPLDFRWKRTPPYPGHLVQNDYDWHLVASTLPEAWAAVGGVDRIATWHDIVIGHIDTGFTEHPALGWRPGGTPCVDLLRDRDFFDKDFESEMNMADRDPASAADRMLGFNCGHGTSTAGVLAGFDPSATATMPGAPPAGHGYLGAAPRIRIVPVRISDCVLINDATDALGRAIEHLLTIPECRVITVSMGATLLQYLPPETFAAIDAAYERGVIVCCAAGNLVRDVVVPAATSRTIAVAGSTIGLTETGQVADLPWSESARGPYVDIAAPAWPIRRPSVDATLFGTLKFGYGYGDGTSYATPQVAATAALWLKKHGATLTARYPAPWQRVAAFTKLVRATARPWHPSLTAYGYGPGLLDAAAVVTAPLPDVSDDDKQPPAAPLD